MIEERTNADGTIRYRVSLGRGSPKRTFTRKADAERYEATLTLDRERKRAGLQDDAKPDITFTELRQRWQDASDPSPWRLKMIAYTEKRWGKVNVRNIEAEDFWAWLLALTNRKGKPLSEKSKAHVLASARQVFSAGVELGYLAKSPARTIKGLTKPPSHFSRVRPIRPFESWDEVLAVAEACAAYYAVAGPLIRFLCATGVRSPGEWIDMEWSQIDLKTKTLSVHGTKTAAAARTVPLGDLAIAALNDVPRSISGGRVFTSRRGGRFNYEDWREKDWHKALFDCGLEHRTPYECRHTFCTLALTEGASIDDVASIMGHEDIAIAYRTYRKWTTNKADRVRDILDKIKPSKTDEAETAHP